jgi:hypothetical protein
VPKHEIRDRLWPRTFVSESNLTTLVAQLRRALGEGARTRPLIRTVRGLGYAFDGEAVPVGSKGPETGRGGACRVWGDEVLPLAEGQNTLGRDPAAQVTVDAPGVSRHHARVVFEGGEATLEDLGSKNGTFAGDRRVDRPTRLRDGDRLRLGRTQLVFRLPRGLTSTRTEQA